MTPYQALSAEDKATLRMMFALGLEFEYNFKSQLPNLTWFKLSETTLSSLDDLREIIFARPVQAPLRDNDVQPVE